MVDPRFEKAWASYPSRAFHLMEEVCALGPRFMGTDGERKVRQLIRHSFGAQGLPRVHAESLEYLGFHCDGASLRVTSPQPFPIPCEWIGQSALTPPGGIEAEVVYAGDGAEKDYDGLAQRGESTVGRIVLADAFKSYQAVPMAEDHWAVGFIMGTRLDEEVARVGVTNLSGLPGRIPAVAITASQSRKLQSLIQQGPIRARIDVKGGYSAQASEILMADAPGTARPDEVVYIVSHFDSHALGPHAADNASGTGALLDLAGFFSRIRPKRTLRFLAFPAEEFGFLGARHYVARHADEVTRAKAVVNLDGFICGAAGRTNAHFTESMRPIVEQALSDFGMAATERACPPKPFSDHYEFQKMGAPVVWLYELDDFYHTALDRPENLDRTRFDANLKTVTSIIWKLANG